MDSALIRLQFISLILFFVTLTLQSQTFSDTSKTPYNFDEIKLSLPMAGESRISNYDYEFCDDDGDGFMEIDIASIERDILSQEGLSDNDEEAVLISTSHGLIVKFKQPFSNANIEVICSPQVSGIQLSDIAVDENVTIYPCYFDSILRLDSANCSLESLFSFPFGTDVNSLSFDTSGNLYYGMGSSSQVYRYDVDELTPPYVWHDFDTGSAGGDFVMLNGKLYISWRQGASYKLFEVTVDENVNYISHVVLGDLPSDTYGLASELGTLYGVNPNRLFRINLDTMFFDDVLLNDGAYGDWWGASGLHEAIEFDVNSYGSVSDAQSQINAIPEIWTNTQSGGQTIYIRIDNLNQNSFTIYPVTISIGIVPQITQPNDLNKCSIYDDLNFDLTDVENELLINNNQNVEVTYYLNYYDMQYGMNVLDTDFYSDMPYRTIHVKVNTIGSKCYASLSFRVVNNEAPNLEPLVSSASERMLSHCYINYLDQGYFKLNEIYQEVAINPEPNDYLEFYTTFENAEDGIFEIDMNYGSTLGLVEELFIKVTNEKGCSTITNFFIDGDCVLTSTDLSNVYFPRFFTPNNDGFYDYWNIKGVSPLMREESEIFIFNRYGKLMANFKPSQTQGWNGTFEGYNLKSDDYWFQMLTNTGKQFSGHFALKR